MTLLADLVTGCMIVGALPLFHRWFSRPRRNHTACDVVAHTVFNTFLAVGSIAVMEDIQMLPSLVLFITASAVILFVSQPNRKREIQHGRIREHNQHRGRSRDRQRSRSGSVPVL